MVPSEEKLHSSSAQKIIYIILVYSGHFLDDPGRCLPYTGTSAQASEYRIHPKEFISLIPAIPGKSLSITDRREIIQCDKGAEGTDEHSGVGDTGWRSTDHVPGDRGGPKGVAPILHTFDC